MPDTLRLFFALWPDPAVREALARSSRALLEECGGRAMHAANIHLTLVFLGNVASDRLPVLLARAAAVKAEPFSLGIDTINYWRHNRLVWAGAGAHPQALRDLVAQLTRHLGNAGFRCEDREYVPHITLLRDARYAPRAQAMSPIEWHAADFALVKSSHQDRATVYEVLQRWPLGCRSC